MSVAKGSCPCGKTEYEFTGEPTMTGICHCTHCRKLTGSTYLTFLMVPCDNFSFTKAQPTPFTFMHKAGVKIYVSRCGECGVALCKTAGSDDSIIVFAGTLDDGSKAINVVPQVELWTKDRVDWCGKVGQGVMREFEGFPPS